MIKIREIRKKDVDSVVRIHCEAFKDFFLTSLGSRFLRLYYSCFIRSNETVSLCAEKDGEVLGFASATKTCRGFNGRLVKSNILSFGLIGVRLCLSKPMSLVRLIKNFSKTSETMEDNEDYAELYSIGVLPCTQGMGIGKMLLSETERIMYGGGKTTVANY